MPSPNHPKHRFFDPKCHLLTHERWKNQKNDIFLKRPHFLFHDKGDCQMACVFFSKWGFFGRQKRTWSTWGKSTTYPHDAEKIGHFFKIRGFPWNLSRIGCRWFPQGRWAPPEHPQDTPPASCIRLPIRPVSARNPQGHGFSVLWIDIHHCTLLCAHAQIPER